MAPSSWPTGWELLELNPAPVTEQRRVKTDAIEVQAITEFVLAGHGAPVTKRAEVIGELAALGGSPHASGRGQNGVEEPVARSTRPCVPRG